MIRRLGRFPAVALLLAACTGTATTPETLHLTSGFVYAPAGTEAAGYVTIENPGPGEDTLFQIRSPAAGMVHLHQQVPDGGMVRMVPVERLPIPPGTTRLAPGGLHLMLASLPGPMSLGDSVDLVLQFQRAGEQAIRVPVIAYGTDPPDAKDLP